jgi:hypothetical protein
VGSSRCDSSYYSVVEWCPYRQTLAFKTRRQRLPQQSRQLKRGWSLRPELLYIKEVSNDPINDYHSTELRVNVRKDF